MSRTTPLSQQLNQLIFQPQPESARSLHDAASQHPLVPRLLSDTNIALDVSLYHKYLGQIYLIYSAMESRLAMLKDDVTLSAFFGLSVYKQLARTDKITNDLLALKPNVPVTAVKPLLPTVDYLKMLAAASPAELAVHYFYVSLMAVLSGGKEAQHKLAKKAKLAGLSTSDGLGKTKVSFLTFYDFDSAHSPGTADRLYKEPFRTALNQIPAEHHSVAIQAARDGFNYALKLFDHLQNEPKQSLNANWTRNTIMLILVSVVLILVANYIGQEDINRIRMVF